MLQLDLMLTNTTTLVLTTYGTDHTVKVSDIYQDDEVSPEPLFYGATVDGVFAGAVKADDKEAAISVFIYNRPDLQIDTTGGMIEDSYEGTIADHTYDSSRVELFRLYLKGIMMG